MNDLSSPRDRYAARARELRLEGEERRAERVLTAAGDLPRRSAALGVDRSAVDAALLALPSHEIEAWAASLAEHPGQVFFSRAAAAAALVALSESPDERALAARAALDALHARDGLESALVALGRRVELGLIDEAAAQRALAAQLEAIDAAAAGRARWLVGLNDLRRRERDLLDPGQRERAHWFSDRASCDGLVSALAGEPGDAASWEVHLHSCAACAADLAGSRSIEAPPTPHLTSEQLLRLELGELAPSERARVERHADGCFDCGQALWALADGERAIEESAAHDLAAP